MEGKALLWLIPRTMSLRLVFKLLAMPRDESYELCIHAELLALRSKTIDVPKARKVETYVVWHHYKLYD